MKRFLKVNFAIGLMAMAMVFNQTSSIYANETNVSYSSNFQFDVNKPFNEELYYARSILNEEGQKAWDVALETLLNYDNSDNKYPQKDGNRLVTINYKNLGINIDKTQAEYVQKYLVRQEPRMFHLKDWDATVKLDGKGMVETQTFYIGNGVSEGNEYQQQLRKIDEEANKILSVVKDDMTVYQKIQAVQKAFESSLVYDNSGSPGDMRGAFLNKKAICGGYSKGFEYLLLKLGISNIWVNGYAGGPHAWNHINIDNKWYLMDTTWGGENWYLRGEVSNHSAYDTYHQMPELEKQGVNYKLGTYPGVWITVPEKIILPLNTSFNPLDYIKEVGDIYEEVSIKNVKVLENNVNIKKPGSYSIVYEVSNKDGNKATASVIFEIIDGKEIPVNELSKINGNLENKSVSLYSNGKEVSFGNGLFGSESKFIEYDVKDKNIQYFEANVGINKNVRDNTEYGHYGKVQFEIYADSKLIYQSSVLGWKDNYENILVEIPKGTKTIKLVNVPKGSGNNHGAWGDAKIFVASSEFDKQLQKLKSLIEFSNKIEDESYVLVDRHKEIRFKNFIYARNKAKNRVEAKDLTIQELKQLNFELLYSTEELGQVYVEGGSPVKK